MIVPRTPLIAALVAAAQLCSGCSLFLVNAPPPEAPILPRFDCTSTNTLPIADTVLAALGGAVAVGVATNANFDATHGPNATATVATITAAWALLFGVSAIVGFRRTGECQEAKGELVQRLTVPGPAPAPYPMSAPVR